MLNYIHVPATEAIPTETGKAEIDKLFAEMAAKQITDITIYSHGGINPYAYGRSRADAFTRVLESKHHHVVTLVWETGVKETLSSQLKHIVDRPVIDKICQYIFDRIQKAFPQEKQPGTLSSGREENSVDENDLLRKALDDNETLTLQDNGDEISAQLEKEFAKALEGDHALISDIREAMGGDKPIIDPALLEQKEGAENARPGTLGIFDNLKLPTLFSDISMQVAQRFENKRDHGPWATIVEEVMRKMRVADLVKTFWDDMKTRAGTMWQENNDQSQFLAGRYFLQKLAGYQTKQPDTTINLVAHSAGSIVMCHLLATIADQFQTLKVNHIIFTAPAVTFDMFYNEIVSKPERFRDFTLFTMSDEQELQDAILPNIYPSSLLYLVSGVLEQDVDHPIAGMMRFFSGKEPFETAELKETRQFLLDPDAERLVLAKQPPTRSGLRVETTTHAHFDKDHKMLDSIRHLLNNEALHN